MPRTLIDRMIDKVTGYESPKVTYDSLPPDMQRLAEVAYGEYILQTALYHDKNTKYMSMDDFLVMMSQMDKEAMDNANTN